MSEHFDLVILGGGPGGYAAALYGASAGMNVAMVEEQRVGGTCLHRGCVPAKELLQTAEVLRTVSNAKEFGVDVAGEPRLELATSQQRKQGVVDKLTKGLESLLKGRKVTVVPSRGVVADGGSHTIRAGDTAVAGDNLVLATGSLPRSLPGFDFDGTRILSSDHVLEITEVPRRVAVIGGGAIGCEFASFLGDVGAEVTVLEVLPQILNGVDRQVAQVVERAFKKRGIRVETGVSVAPLDGGDGPLVVRYDNASGSQTIEVDQLVVSVGRRPRVEDIGLEAAGIRLDERGFIAVDDHMRASVPGIYAVGDVVATAQLAHVAFAEAIVAVKTMLGESTPGVDYAKVPWGIYCHPEVGFCGLTEEQATEKGIDVVTSVHRFGGNSRALIMGEAEGLVKIVAERDGAIVGVHVAGPWATELIAEGYLSVNWEATADDLGALIHADPTLSELFGESALALTGRSLHG